MTDQEKQFLTNLLKNITISPASDKAAETVTMIQGILKQLAANTQE